MKKITDGSLSLKVDNISIFQYLNENERRQLLNICDVFEYYKGERIITQGEVSSCFFVVLSGSLKVTFTDPGGAEVFISNIQAGDFFGETGIFSDAKRTANVSPLDTVQILRIGREDFFHFIRMYSHAGVKLLMLFVYGLMKKLNDSNQGLVAMERKTVLNHSDVDQFFKKEQ